MSVAESLAFVIPAIQLSKTVIWGAPMNHRSSMADLTLDTVLYLGLLLLGGIVLIWQF